MLMDNKAFAAGAAGIASSKPSNPSVNSATKKPEPNGPLNLKTIKSNYQEGDFDKVKIALEPHMKNGGAQLSPEEKIFTYKYLGVVYAADSSTIPLAKNAFYQLIKLSPNIEIVDLYVSDKIQSLFNEVKHQFQSEADYAQKYDEYGKPINNSKKPNSVPKKGDDNHNSNTEQKLNRTGVYWTAGVIGAAVVAGGAWWIMSSTKASSKSTTEKVGL